MFRIGGLAGPGPAGVPIMRAVATVYDTKGRPVEVQDTVAAADRHEFQYEVSMADDHASRQ